MNKNKNNQISGGEKKDNNNNNDNDKKFVTRIMYLVLSFASELRSTLPMIRFVNVLYDPDAEQADWPDEPVEFEDKTMKIPALTKLIQTTLLLASDSDYMMLVKKCFEELKKVEGIMCINRLKLSRALISFASIYEISMSIEFGGPFWDVKNLEIVKVVLFCVVKKLSVLKMLEQTE